VRPAIALILALVFGLLLVGLATLERGVMVLAFPLLVYVFAAIWQRPEILDLTLKRVIAPENAAQGVPVTVYLTLTNVGPAQDEVTVRDVLSEGAELLDGSTQQMAYLAPSERIELEYTMLAPRGTYNIYEVQVDSRDFTSLFEMRRLYRSPSSLVIHPHYPKLDRIKIRPPQTRGFAGPIGARQGGNGVDFWSVREYQSGDPQRHINWRLASRSQHELYTNIYEQQRVADVGLILDARQKVDVITGDGALFEHAVRATAALAENFLDDGNRVSLLIYGAGRQHVFPGYGKVHRNRILKALAQAQTGFNYALENLNYLPTRLFPAGSQVVMVSALVPEDIPTIVTLRARGYAVMVISPNPIAFEAAQVADRHSPAYRLAYAEREFMLRKLRRSGVQVVDWIVDEPLEAITRRLLTRQPPPINRMRLG
jgi:uncharacterized protein (DUF58 family)